jgi:fibronectin-binding autotransporter adhesin
LNASTDGTAAAKLAGRMTLPQLRRGAGSIAVCLKRCALAALALGLVVGTGHAQDGTWLLNPGSNDFATGSNWSGGTVPTDTATFAASNTTSLTLSITTALNTIEFNAGAPAYSLAIAGSNLPPPNVLLLLGAGIVNNSSNAQNFSVNTAVASLQFLNSSSAGNAIITNFGPATGSTFGTVFGDMSSAATATIFNNSGGATLIENSSTAGNATITNTGVVSSTAESGGLLDFIFGGNAGSANITNDIGGFTVFQETSSANASAITNNNGGSLLFLDASTAANATIMNNNGGNIAFGLAANNTGVIFGTMISAGPITGPFTATAANAAITNSSGGSIFFFGGTTGGQAQFINNTGGVIDISGLTDGGMTAGSIAGGGNVFLGGNALTLGGNGLSTTISGVISDGGAEGGAGGSLIVNGAVTLTLSAINTYSGGTTVSGAGSTLAVANSAALGTGPVAMGAGTVFQFATSGVNIGNAMTVAGDPTFVTSPGSTKATPDIYSGLISDLGPGPEIGAVVVDGGGFIALTNANTYSGGTTICGATATTTCTHTNGGTPTTLIVNNSTPGTSSSIGIGALTFDGGVLQAGAGNLSFNNGIAINSTGGAIDSNGQTITFSGAIANGNGTTGNLTIESTVAGGTVVLSGDNTYTGGTTVSSGTLKAGSTTGFSSGSAFTVAGTLDLAGFSNTIGSLAGAGTVESSTGTATLMAGGDNSSTTFSGNLINGGGTLGLTKAGTGTLTLSGADTYTGATNVSAGTLQAGSTTGFSSGSAFTVGGTLDLNGFSNTIGSLAGAGTVKSSTGTATLTAGGDNSSTTFSGNLINGGGTLGLTKAGTGTLILSGADSYTGVTTVSAGTLQAGSMTGFSSGSAYTVGGTLDLAGFSNAIGSLAGAGTVESSTGTATLTAGGNNTSTTFSGNLINGGGTGLGLTKAGTGTLTLSGADTYTGATNVSAGTLQAGSTTGFSSGSAFTVGGTLDLAGFSNTIGSLAGAGTVESSTGLLAILTAGGDNSSTTFSGNLINGGGTLGLTKAGAGTLILSGDNTYTGATTVSAGTLQAGSATAFSSGSAYTVAGTLDLGGFSQTIASLSGSGSVLTSNAPATLTISAASGATTFSGVIADGVTPEVLSLVKAGGSTQILTGANTYTGGTTISGGVLQLGAGGATGSIVGNVTDNATLKFDRSDAYTFGGLVSGAGAVGQIGAGALALTAANTYSGGTLISAGTLRVSNANGLTSSSVGTGTVTLTNGAIFQATTAGLTFANPFTLAGVGGQIETTTNPGDTLTLSGVVSGSGGIKKIGMNGTLILAGANTYSGGTGIFQGIVQATNASSVGTGTVYLAGGVFQAGANNLTFANAFALDANGPPTAAGGGARIDTNGNTLTLAGVVSDGDAPGLGGTGPGALAKHGAGELILTGANTYSGGTYLFAGAIGVGNSAALGTGALAMSDGTTLQATANHLTLANAISLAGIDTIDTQANAFTLAGAISGTGALTQIGSGNLTLSNANSYSGGTTVVSGTLTLGNAAALGTGALKMDAGATLAFSANKLSIANAITLGAPDPTIDTGGNTETLAGVISGAGSLTKIGSGSLDLTATNTYTGATIISAGTLVVDGSIASSSSLTIAAGATLGGSGTVPGFIVPSGATIAPGALTPFSTLHVAGALGFLSGSAYTVNINPAGANDKIVATGAATLSGGTVYVVPASGGYSTANRYTILTAGGGVTGAFSSVTTTSNLAFLTPTLSYDADDVYLGFTLTTPFPSLAITRNQVATATAIQALGAGAPIYDAVIGQSAAGARQAFDALSGEIHASAVSEAFDDTRLPREAVLDRLSSPYGALPTGGAAGFAAMNAIAGPSVPADVFAAWGQAFGSFGHIGGDGNAATVDRSMGGFVLGLDATLDARYRLGVAAGYTDSSLSIAARGSSGSVQSTYGGLYGGASLNALQLRGGAFYAYNRYGTSRNVAFPGFFDVDSAGYGGDTLQAFGEAGWRVPVSGFAGPTFVEPIAALTAMHIETAAYTETGGAAALTSASAGYDYAATTLGVRAEATLFSNVPLTARGMLGWRHVFGDVTPDSTLAFASAPSIPFTIAGAPIARDSLAIEAGFDWKLTSNATVGVFYSGELGAHDVDNAIKGKLEVAF